MAVLEFEPYLSAIVSTPTMEDWGDGRYTLTLAELPLRVQTVVTERESEGGREGRGERSFAPSPDSQQADWDGKAQPRRVQYAVLEGLRKIALDENQHVLLVGRPGSGKSTALKRFLWEEAQGCLTALRLPSPQPLSQVRERDLKIPVLLELREFRSGTVLTWIQQKLRLKRLRLSEDEITDLLLDGTLLLLFDGLNEIPASSAWQELGYFRRDFATTRMIFSTRELGATADLGIEKKLEMLPLTEPQMREFIQKRLPGQAEQLLRQMQGRLRELAETPLLLKMLCDTFTDNGEIPKSRGELFRKEFDRRYDSFKSLRVQNVDENFRHLAKKLLQVLAVEMMKGGSPTDLYLQISKEDAEQILKDYLQKNEISDAASLAPRYLEQLLSHHLLQLAVNAQKIEFHHQLFQEYYAAEWLLTQLPDLLRDKQGKKLLKQDYLNYLKWTEVVSVMLALVEDEEQALECVKLGLELDLGIGARLVGSVQQRYQTQSVELLADRKFARSLEMALFEIIDSEAGQLKALEDSELNVRKNAAEVLDNLGGEADVAGLVKALEESDFYVRMNAEKALRNLRSETAIPSLVKALEHPVSSVRSNVAIALGNLRSETAIPGLLIALEDSDNYVRRGAARALGKLGSQAAIHGLLIALKDSDKYVRRFAAEELGKLGSATDIILSFLTELEDVDSFVRRNAAEVLGNLGGQVAIPGLLIALKDSDNYVRRFAAEALGKLGSQAAIPGLIKALEDYDSGVRREAAEALGKLGSQAAIPGLIKALEDYDPFVNFKLAKLLGQIGTPKNLAMLWKMQLQVEHRNILPAIFTIQKRCGFYNYEIWQTTQKRQHQEETRNQQSGTVNYDLRGATIGNLAHEVKGDQKNFGSIASLILMFATNIFTLLLMLHSKLCSRMGASE